MFNISKKFKLMIAGGLLALTAFAAGLTMSVAFNAKASTPAVVETVASTSNTASDWAAPAAAPAAMGDDGEDFGFGSDFGAMAMQFMGNFASPTDFFSQGISKSLSAMPQTGGKISKIDGDKLTVAPGDRIINVTAQTAFGDANGTLNKSDLKVNDLVFALGKVENGGLTARWVLRLPAPPDVKRGTVTSVTAASKQFKFTVGKEEYTATLADNAEISKNGAKVAIDALAKDDQVIVTGKADNTAKTIQAQRVIAGKMPATRGNAGLVRGAIKSIDANANSLVVTEKVSGKDTDITVKVDANTKYVGQNLKALGDLKVGDQVFVTGQKESDTVVKATSIGTAPDGKGGPKQGNGSNGAGPRGGNPFFRN